MKTIMKLTNEYASNLKALLFGFKGSVARPYYGMFTTIFKDCILANTQEIAKCNLNHLDIVFIRITDNTEFQD